MRRRMKINFLKKFRLFSGIDGWIPPVLHRLLTWILNTCKVEVVGLEGFLQVAGKKPCMLALWHNRLSPVLFVLDRYTPKTIDYLAVVSASRDGKILSRIISSYQNGKTLLVTHLGRLEALKQLMEEVKKPHQVVVITPDGPRGPCYKIKPGMILAAKEADAAIFHLNWTASRIWQLKSWDRFRLPQPFSTLTVHFSPAIRLDRSSPLTLEEETRRMEAWMGHRDEL